jgi:PhoH-like ATPase
VLLADPGAMFRFAEHEVVLPIVVITELEAKRDHPELGWFARQSLRLLDELRLERGRLDAPLPVTDAGGTLRVELNHTDPAVLPPGYRLGDNDSRLLAVARNLAAEGADVVLVSKDMPLRIKAASIGLQAQEYLAEQVESGWTGMAELDVAGDDVAALYAEETLDLPEARDLPCHTGVVLMSERDTAQAREDQDKKQHKKQ